jgi:hypothetical protein
MSKEKQYSITASILKRNAENALDDTAFDIQYKKRLGSTPPFKYLFKCDAKLDGVSACRVLHNTEAELRLTPMEYIHPVCYICAICKKREYDLNSKGSHKIYIGEITYYDSIGKYKHVNC